ncbi:MAG: hypothetical protein HY811_01785 [Planctomycetes bacterium]|nr:hypothetical protein [Planctomycetota bacterium]
MRNHIKVIAVFLVLASAWLVIGAKGCSWFNSDNDDEIITGSSESNDVKIFNSIVVDTTNKIHISFDDTTHRLLKYATNITGTWNITTIDTIGAAGGLSSLAIDNNNKVHISYQHSDIKSLKYATNITGTWSTYIIDTPAEGLRGTKTSLALDTNNKVHICYVANSACELRYATNITGAWTVTTLDGGIIDPDGAASIALDSNNNIYISYWKGNDLRYATNLSGSWVSSVINSGPAQTSEGNNMASIGIDTNNKAHICYFVNLPYSDIRYTTNVSGDWVSSTVDGTGDVGRWNSIALDSNNKVHISYWEGSDTHFQSLSTNLKYASNVSGSWQIDTIDSQVGMCNSIMVDTNNKVHISYFGLTNNSPKYATNASGSWVISTINQ